MQIDIVPVQSLAALGESWRALEAEAAGPSFFQSWTWVGCLAEERYPDPVLLRAEAHGRVLALALFNRRRGRLCLGESGEPLLDAPFVEHNAPLLSAAAGPGVLRDLLRAAWRVPGVRRLVLSGVPPALLGAAGGNALRLQHRDAPFLDLEAVRASGGDWMAVLSANTRHQIRRSARRYEAQHGPLLLRRAETVEEALGFLDGLITLHAATWRARGQPGAFAGDYLRRFHRTLVARALPRGEVDLLRVSAGGTVVGYLYNLRLAGRVLAYQSGLDHAGAGPHGKPGLTCHAMAIERALSSGDGVYDFLGGADRYKLSLSNAAATLAWAELVPTWSPLGLAARLWRALPRRAGAG